MLPFDIVTVNTVFGIRISGGTRSSGTSVGIPPSAMPLPGCKSNCIVDRVRTAITRAGISCESLFICAESSLLVPEDQAELTIHRWHADPHAIPGAMPNIIGAVSGFTLASIARPTSSSIAKIRSCLCPMIVLVRVASSCFMRGRQAHNAHRHPAAAK